jgi:predicted nuclease of restriction endonuclease-like RecB superfamily
MKPNVDRLKSKFEAEVYKAFTALQTQYSFKFEYETENLPYVSEHSYYPDWVVKLSSGKKFYVESKGWLRPEDRRKMREILQQHKDKDIRFLFQRDQPIYKGAKSNYSDWAQSLGCKWCVGAIPKSWFEE